MYMRAIINIHYSHPKYCSLYMLNKLHIPNHNRRLEARLLVVLPLKGFAMVGAHLDRLFFLSTFVVQV